MNILFLLLPTLLAFAPYLFLPLRSNGLELSAARSPRRTPCAC